MTASDVLTLRYSEQQTAVLTEDLLHRPSASSSSLASFAAEPIEININKIRVFK